MALVRTVEPADEPVTLVEAKTHLKQDLTDDDNLIRALIAAARSAVEEDTHRALCTQTLRLTIDDDWPLRRERSRDVRQIVLPRPPLASVTSVTYVDLNGATQTLATSQYTVSKRETGLWTIAPAYDVIWPDVRCVPEAITVTYIAGSAVSAVPAPIKSAILLLIGHWYENREAVITGTIATTLPMTVRYLLDPYCIRTPA